MLGQPGEDYPRNGAVLDLIPASRGETFLSWVDVVDGDDIVVTAPRDRSMRPLDASTGERVDLVWKGATELHCLPCELVAVEASEQPRWLLRRAGAVQRGQRRDAVRAPLSVPVRLGQDGAAVEGTTVDVSEGGVHCVLERGALPAWISEADRPGHPAGTVVTISVMLSDLTITCLAEITRLFPRRDTRIELSVRFIGLSEHDQDELRRRIFGRLRELRQRGLI